MEKINKIGILICSVLVLTPILSEASVMTKTINPYSDSRSARNDVKTIMGKWGWGNDSEISGFFKVKTNNSCFTGAVDIIDGEIQYDISGVFNSTHFKGFVYIDDEPEEFYGQYTIEGNIVYGTWFWRRGYGWFKGIIQ